MLNDWLYCVLHITSKLFYTHENSIAEISVSSCRNEDESILWSMESAISSERLYCYLASTDGCSGNKNVTRQNRRRFRLTERLTPISKGKVALILQLLNLKTSWPFLNSLVRLLETFPLHEPSESTGIKRSSLSFFEPSTVPERLCSNISWTFLCKKRKRCHLLNISFSQDFH